MSEYTTLSATNASINLDNSATISETTEHSAPSLSKLLGGYGAGYVLLRRMGETYRNKRGDTVVATGKEPKSNDWQRNPATLAEAARHAKGGGNVGLACGYAGLFEIDIDKDRAGAFELWPALANTVEVYRTTAPDRAKFILLIDGDLPLSAKNHASGTEILAAGSQGVIYGTHHTGAPILHRGDSILTVTAAQVADFWQKRTQTALESATPIVTSTPDASAVKRSMALVDRVLGMTGNTDLHWQPFDGSGRKAVLDVCPFNPSDNPHAQDGGAAVLVGADGRIGATCHHARCQERIKAHGRGWSLLKEIAGYTSTPDAAPDADQAWADLLAHVAQLEGLREWVRRADFAEFVPILLQAENGYRTRDTDIAAADAILDVATSAGRVTGLAVGVRKLRALMGVGSTSTVTAALDRLSGWFVVQDAPNEDDNGMTARRWSVAPSLLKMVAEASCVDRTLLSFDTTDHTSDRGCSIYATSPLATERARDAFILAQAPICESEVAERIEARNEARSEAKRAGLPVPKRLRKSRYARRLSASMPSAGRAVLRIIDALTTEAPDGALDHATLRNLTNMSKYTLSRAIARGVELELLETDDRHTVTLADDWRGKVDLAEPHMPTFGRQLEREISDIDAGLRWIDANMRKPELSEGERKRMERRRSKLAVRKREAIEARYGVTVSAEVASTPARYGQGDSLQTQAQVLNAQKPRQQMSETERFLLDRFGSEYSEDVAARWARFNSQMTTQWGAGWFANMSQAEIALEGAAWAAQGYGV